MARQEKTAEETPRLRVPALAGALAWLIPGAGHLYQRRYFKAAVFGLSVWTCMIVGWWMGSYTQKMDDGSTRRHFARVVYCSWRSGDVRLAFIPQACVGVMALPAFKQARRPQDATESISSTAFAPPRRQGEERTRPNQPTANDLWGTLHSWFELGTLYTMVAGMLNLLAIFDAVGGPNIQRRSEEELEKEKAKKEKGILARLIEKAFPPKTEEEKK